MMSQLLAPRKNPPLPQQHHKKYSHFLCHDSIGHLGKSLPLVRRRKEAESQCQYVRKILSVLYERISKKWEIELLAWRPCPKAWFEIAALFFTRPRSESDKEYCIARPSGQLRLRPKKEQSKKVWTQSILKSNQDRLNRIGCRARLFSNSVSLWKGRIAKSPVPATGECC